MNTKDQHGRRIEERREARFRPLLGLIVENE